MCLRTFNCDISLTEKELLNIICLSPVFPWVSIDIFFTDIYKKIVFVHEAPRLHYNFKILILFFLYKINKHLNKALNKAMICLKAAVLDLVLVKKAAPSLQFSW